MKTTLIALLTSALIAAAPFTRAAAVDTSVKNQARDAVHRGVTFLLERQNDNGSWLDQPPITALAAMALHQNMDMVNTDTVAPAIEKARQYILSFAQKDGRIAAPDSRYVNYTTSVCLSALAILNHPDDTDVMRRARHFIIGLQLDEDNAEHPTSPDNPFYGGIGYGSGGPKHPDLSNTQWALEALYLTEHLDKDTDTSEQSELAWNRALDYLKAVQNIPEDAGPTWVVNTREDPENDGGFIYRPDQSKVTEKLEAQGEDTAEGLRSYGSMTYAGLKSMVYADVDKDDYRVRAALDWARKHYTLKENPVMGTEGHYYYLLTFGKALGAFGEDTLKTADGATRNWREDLLRTLIELQKDDGQWFNERNGRWMESIPELVTAYALIAMDVALED